MTKSEKLLTLINYLLNENEEYSNIQIPDSEDARFKLYRSLVNVRMPAPVSEEYLKLESEFLKAETESKGVVCPESLSFDKNGLCIFQGDITTIACGAIVNAANSQLLGCFYPCHSCIDNCIHTYSGVRLRLKCNEIMKLQNTPEETGKAKITPAYNLPCKYVIHTVGPIINSALTNSDRLLLASCYKECLKLADAYSVKTIAFCCISTGEFHFPNEEAAQIAVKTVLGYKEKSNSDIKVIFNVFKDKDRIIYESLLKQL